MKKAHKHKKRMVILIVASSLFVAPLLLNGLLSRTGFTKDLKEEKPYIGKVGRERYLGSIQNPLSVQDLIRNKKFYHGRKVIVKDEYFEGYEEIVLGSINTIWVHWADRSLKQLVRDHGEKIIYEAFGREYLEAVVLVEGTFETGGAYGHMGTYKNLIDIESVKVFDEKRGEFIGGL